MLLHLTCAFEVITLQNERVIALFHHFFFNFDISLKSIKKSITPELQDPVQCILQILTIFNLYSGRPRVGLSVNNKEKVRQAMVKISRGAGGNHPPPPSLPLGQICQPEWLDHCKVKKEAKNSLLSKDKLQRI